VSRSLLRRLSPAAKIPSQTRNGRLIARVRMMPLLSLAKSLPGKGTRPIFAYLLTLEQGFKSRGLGPKILFGRTNLRSELRCGVPGPTRIVDNRTRQGDHVSIAGRDDGFGLLEAGDEPDRDYRHSNDGLDGSRERHLIAWSHGYLLGEVEPAA